MFVTRHSLIRANGPAIRSLERMARYLFYCMFFLFVRFFVNNFSTTRGPIQAKFCMRAYSGSGCVFSPFGGWRLPAGGIRGNEIFVTMGVNGEFLHFGGFWTISQQCVDGSTPNFICVGTMSADVPLPPLGSIAPWGQGGGVKNLKNWGIVSFVLRTATISIFLSIEWATFYPFAFQNMIQHHYPSLTILLQQQMPFTNLLQLLIQFANTI